MRLIVLFPWPSAPDYYLTHLANPDRHVRRLTAQLQTLGYHVTLAKAAS